MTAESSIHSPAFFLENTCLLLISAGESLSHLIERVSGCQGIENLEVSAELAF
ncbi:hypothetical protein PFWH6_3891 [Pseudomonas fluorescens WH6]|nr:hypothetical protein PFWH6_3891 [Pseudomonas fluorescens WH6]